MSEEIKIEPEDEENLKTTPIRDYQEDNKQSDDEQHIERPTSSHVFDKERQSISESLAGNVKTEPEYELNAKTTQQQVIETLEAGITSMQNEPKTPERLDGRKVQNTLRYENEPTQEVNGVNEPVGRTKLFADDTTDINVTIGKVRVHEKTIAHQDFELENRKIKVCTENTLKGQQQQESEETQTSSKEKLKAIPEGNSCGKDFNKNLNSDIQKELLKETPLTSKTLQHENQQPIQSNNDSNKTAMKKNSQPNTDTDKTQMKENSTNSISQESLQMQVKTDPENYNNDAVDFDETLARPSTSESNIEMEKRTSKIVANSVPTEISEATVNKIAANEIVANKRMDFEETITRPSNPETEAPPPSILIPRIRDSDTDGISTPRISVASMSRLRVKTELSLFQTPTPSNAEISSLPQDFFEDLLTVNERCESGEVTPYNSDDARSQDEPIPDNFFDDLLRDQLKERIEEARNNDLEEKYSDRLKELEKLENELKRLDEKSRKKNHKKQKKSKKKSHKRPRSKSPSHSSREKERERHRRSPSPNHIKKKRSRLSPPPLPTLQQLPSTSNYGSLNRVTVDTASLGPARDSGIQVKSEFHTLDISNKNINCDLNEDVEMFATPIKIEPPPPPVVSCEEIEEIEAILTTKQKIERAKQRACYLISHLKNMSSDPALSTFQFTSTVRKLPASHSYVHQQIYENRSPLHTVNNVNYKFNSHATRFNMEEWGLATLPSQAAKIAKLVGCDAQTIHNKLKTIKIPAKLQKIKTESLNDEGKELVETTSSLFSNAMTQTDELEELAQRKTKGYEIGVQVEPSICHIGCQTLEIQSPTDNNQRGATDELPIMKIMRDLNENQLMAIHDFAELIKEPAVNAMDMYSLRMRMLEIYKCSQLPSALAAPQPQVINNYTTSSTRNSPQTHRRTASVQQPIIQSVIGADGTQFSINDPRAKSAAYTSRVGSSSGSSSSSTNHDPRYSAFQQLPGNRNASALESRNYSSSTSFISRQRLSSNQPQPPTSGTTKYYGRGGLRRQ